MASAGTRKSGAARFIDGLLGRSSLTSVRSPFESFGPLAAASAHGAASNALASDSVGIFDDLARVAIFTVEEARRRLSAFLSGTFRPRSGSEFVSYLKANLLGIEKRSYGGGRASMHIVDALTRQSVPAASIDPQKLSEQAIRTTLGRDPKADRRTLAEASVAQEYRAKLAPFLRAAADSGKPPFSGWDDVGFTLPAALKGKAYAVRDGEGYVGTPVGTCDMTPEKTRAFLIEKRAEISRQVGRPVRFVFDQAMTPGTPILIADRNLVRARSIDKSLSSDRLEAAFGRSHSDYHRALGKTPLAAQGQASVVSIEAFRARFARKKAAAAATTTPEAAVAEGVGFGFTDPGVPVPPAQRTFDPKHVVIQYGNGAPRIWHAKRQRELADVPSFHLLPEGDYLKEDQFGMPMGKLRVDRDGDVTHMTMDGREHNFDGASFEPAPGSDKPRRWAIEGQQFDRFRDFKARRDEIAASHRAAEETAPEAAAERHSGSFGYRA